MGELDDTLVLYIWGDNGASLEGTLTGSFNEMTMINGVPLTPDQQLSLIDQYGGLGAWGTDATAPHYAVRLGLGEQLPVPVGQAGRQPPWRHTQRMVVAWPRRIAGRTDVRSQFTHVIDIGPTILEAAGIPEAKMVDGVAPDADGGHELPLHLRRRRRARTPHAAVLRDLRQPGHLQGRLVGVREARPRPWDVTPATLARFAPDKYDPENDTWELYYLPDDFSQAKDLAAEHPEKLAELKELFWEEAEKYKVLPLLAGFSVFFGILPPMPTITKHTLYGDVENVLAGMVPRVYGHSYAITADLHIPDGGAEGVIVAEADEMGGFSLFVQDGKLKHTYSMLGVEVYRQESDGGAAQRAT